jgi:hypothetical protein
VTATVALATAAEFPDLDEDGSMLLAALAGRGVQAEPAVWTDASVDWSGYDAVVVRCTWDYQHQRDRFLDWTEQVAAVTRLANPADVIRWNTHKGYLRELAEAGLPVVTTTWLEPGDAFQPPGSGEYVVKPAVSAGSRDTNRYVAGSHDGPAAEHVAGLLAQGRTVMVQPYLAAVDTAGETAMLYFAGEFSHAVRKAPLLEPLMDFVAGAYKPEEIHVREPSAEERRVADRVLEVVRDRRGWGADVLTYARVDLVPDAAGAPTLLELELTEPSMFLEYGTSADAADRFATAIAALVGGTREE